jgi:uncharacterized protein YjbI with pentapeptide repeats
MVPEKLAEVLALNAKYQCGEEGGVKADLRGADLSGVNLRGVNLSEADLRKADLCGASLREANLSEADLSGANLGGADLFKANLSGANLSEANLSYANLFGANLSYANLSEADLCKADLSGANLREANLSKANLFGADLFEADLFGVGLREADLSEADLSEASLIGADLRGAASWCDVNLHGVRVSYRGGVRRLRMERLSDADETPQEAAELQNTVDALVKDNQLLQHENEELKAQNGCLLMEASRQRATIAGMDKEIKERKDSWERITMRVAFRRFERAVNAKLCQSLDKIQAAIAETQAALTEDAPGTKPG